MKGWFANTGLLAGRWRGLLFDLLFPPRCVSCRRVGAIFCTDCRAQIDLIRPPLCVRCGAPLLFSAQPCSACRSFPLNAHRIRSVAYFSGPLRDAIHAFKYRRRAELAAPLAELLVRYLREMGRDYDIIAAVPLHPSRLEERGYNQSERLAREVATQLEVSFAGGLSRIRPTADQVGLDGWARHENVRGAFKAGPVGFYAARVLLIDDVCTTGATIDSCAQALLREGAQSVFGLTIARPKQSYEGGRHADDYYRKEHASVRMARNLRPQEDWQTQQVPERPSGGTRRTL